MLIDQGIKTKEDRPVRKKEERTIWKVIDGEFINTLRPKSKTLKRDE